MSYWLIPSDQLLLHQFTIRHFFSLLRHTRCRTARATACGRTYQLEWARSQIAFEEERNQ